MSTLLYYITLFCCSCFYFLFFFSLCWAKKVCYFVELWVQPFAQIGMNYTINQLYHEEDTTKIVCKRNLWTYHTTKDLNPCKDKVTIISQFNCSRFYFSTIETSFIICSNSKWWWHISTRVVNNCITHFAS